MAIGHIALTVPLGDLDPHRDVRRWSRTSSTPRGSMVPAGPGSAAGRPAGDRAEHRDSRGLAFVLSWNDLLVSKVLYVGSTPMLAPAIVNLMDPINRIEPQLDGWADRVDPGTHLGPAHAAVSHSRSREGAGSGRHVYGGGRHGPDPATVRDPEGVLASPLTRRRFLAGTTMAGASAPRSPRAHPTAAPSAALEQRSGRDERRIRRTQRGGHVHPRAGRSRSCSRTTPASTRWSPRMGAADRSEGRVHP